LTPLLACWAVALAAASGLRPMMVAFYLSLGLRHGFIKVVAASPVSELASVVRDDVVFYILAVLAVLEVLGDKGIFVVPGIDIVLTLLRPVSGVAAPLLIIPIREMNALIPTAIGLGALGVLPIAGLQARAGLFRTFQFRSSLLLMASFGRDLIALFTILLAKPLPYVALAVVYVATFVLARTLAGQSDRMDAEEEAKRVALTVHDRM